MKNLFNIYHAAVYDYDGVTSYGYYLTKSAAERAIKTRNEGMVWEKGHRDEEDHGAEVRPINLLDVVYNTFFRKNPYRTYSFDINKNGDRCDHYSFLPCPEDKKDMIEITKHSDSIYIFVYYKVDNIEEAYKLGLKTYNDNRDLVEQLTDNSYLVEEKNKMAYIAFWEE